MGNGNSLINLGDFAEPANTLIQRISDAIGGIYKPSQIKRLAKAEVEAKKIKVLGDIEINDIQQRALIRFVNEETNKQINIEEIVKKALPNIEPKAEPNKIENDWLINFFDKCKLVSDEDMRLIWANVLSGEANNPGTFSKRTINFISEIDKVDAQSFTNLCSFCWNIDDDYIPLIFDYRDPIYQESIDFPTIKHLDSIGLISYSSGTDYHLGEVSSNDPFSYYGKKIKVESKSHGVFDINLGKVILTKTGEELYSIVNSVSRPGFFDYVVKYWRISGLIITYGE